MSTQGATSGDPPGNLAPTEEAVTSLRRSMGKLDISDNSLEEESDHWRSFALQLYSHMDKLRSVSLSAFEVEIKMLDEEIKKIFDEQLESHQKMYKEFFDTLNKIFAEQLESLHQSIDRSEALDKGISTPQETALASTVAPARQDSRPLLAHARL